MRLRLSEKLWEFHKRKAGFNLNNKDMCNQNVEKKYSLVVWDDIKMAFIPCNTISGIPLFEKGDCLEICEQLTAIVNSATWQPKVGDVYYHPISWVPKRNFIPMDNEATSDVCPYPSFKTIEECQIICDKMNRYLQSKLSDLILPDVKTEERSPENEIQKIGDILRERFGN